jgi:hypothetical protein
MTTTPGTDTPGVVPLRHPPRPVESKSMLRRPFILTTLALVITIGPPMALSHFGIRQDMAFADGGKGGGGGGDEGDDDGGDDDGGGSGGDDGGGSGGGDDGGGGSGGGGHGGGGSGGGSGGSGGGGDGGGGDDDDDNGGGDDDHGGGGGGHGGDGGNGGGHGGNGGGGNGGGGDDGPSPKPVKGDGGTSAEKLFRSDVIRLTYANGTSERITKGQYERLDTRGRVVERHRATAADQSRLRSLRETIARQGAGQGLQQAIVVNSRQGAVQVTDTAGWSEVILDGRYTLTDPNGNVVTRRTATADDISRLQAAAGLR